MRLDRFIANATGLSRKDVQLCLREGRVTSAGTMLRDGGAAVPQTPVELDGTRIMPPEPVYLMMHKPAGYVCATTDGSHPTVLDLLPRRLHPTDPLQIVGRLDLDTTGLLLLTTDGKWNHHLTAPGNRCSKTYVVDLAEPLAQETVSILENGMLLRSEAKPTLPCRLVFITPKRVNITLQEGRYHQVKRMFAAVGNHVVALHREQVGGLTLDPIIKPGEYRFLTSTEVALTWQDR